MEGIGSQPLQMSRDSKKQNKNGPFSDCTSAEFTIDEKLLILPRMERSRSYIADTAGLYLQRSHYLPEQQCRGMVIRNIECYRSHSAEAATAIFCEIIEGHSEKR